MHKYIIEDEQRKCSDYSPGIILNSEELYRITLHPEHISSTGEILPVAISTTDLESKGFSVERKTYSNARSICDLAAKQVNHKPTRDYAEIAKLKCETIRAMNYEQTQDRSFLVIDEALEKNIAHASIYSAVKMPTKSILRKLRIQLSPLLENRIPLDSLTI